MPSRRRKLIYPLGILLCLVLAIAGLRTEPARRVLGLSSMYVGAYNGMRRDLTKIAAIPFRWRSDGIIRDYVRDHTVRKLQIGAGATRPEGWLNTDIDPGDSSEGLAYLDATDRFPLEDESFHYVFSEHVIEHLTYPQGQDMLSESYRVLAPGGRIRIATPNLLRLVGLFQPEKTDSMEEYLVGKLEWHDWPRVPTPECFILNYELTWFDHRFVYDPGTLAAALQQAGFVSVDEYEVGQSDDPELRGAENRAVSELNNYETMVFEAVKP